MRQRRCTPPGPVSLKIAPAGAISGEIDVLETGSCQPLKGKLEGRVEGDFLRLNLLYSNRSIAFSLTRIAKPD